MIYVFGILLVISIYVGLEFLESIFNKEKK